MVFLQDLFYDHLISSLLKQIWIDRLDFVTHYCLLYFKIAILGFLTTKNSLIFYGTFCNGRPGKIGRSLPCFTLLAHRSSLKSVFMPVKLFYCSLVTWNIQGSIMTATAICQCSPCAINCATYSIACSNLICNLEGRYYLFLLYSQGNQSSENSSYLAQET